MKNIHFLESYSNHGLTILQLIQWNSLILGMTLQFPNLVQLILENYYNWISKNKYN